MVGMDAGALARQYSGTVMGSLESGLPKLYRRSVRCQSRSLLQSLAFPRFPLARTTDHVEDHRLARSKTASSVSNEVSENVAMSLTHRTTN